jgi:hypothetical protein
MHWTTLSVGVLAIAVSLYCFLGIAYPFVSFYSDPVFGNFVLLIGGLIFGAFGCYLSWESVVKLEDRGVAKKINRKRKRKFGAVNAGVN